MEQLDAELDRMSADSVRVLTSSAPSSLMVSARTTSASSISSAVGTKTVHQHVDEDALKAHMASCPRRSLALVAVALAPAMAWDLMAPVAWKAIGDPGPAAPARLMPRRHPSPFWLREMEWGGAPKIVLVVARREAGRRAVGGHAVCT